MGALLDAMMLAFWVAILGGFLSGSVVGRPVFLPIGDLCTTLRSNALQLHASRLFT